jgi:hypothetical protein
MKRPPQIAVGMANCGAHPAGTTTPRPHRRGGDQAIAAAPADATCMARNSGVNSATERGHVRLMKAAPVNGATTAVVAPTVSR